MTHDTIYTYTYPMPLRIKGYTVYMDDVYTIVINSNMSEESRYETYIHEMKHIQRGDFHSKSSASSIEKTM